MSVLWPLSGEKRKWLGHRQTDAIDPTADSSDLQNGKVSATARRVRRYLAAHSRQGISKLTHVSSRVKIRAKSQPGP
jgi:hypothetical protein